MQHTKYLILGGTGSLGKKLIDRLVIHDCNTVAVYSRDEAKHWTIKNELHNQTNLKFYVGDIRDINRIKDVIRQYEPTVIIVASALKQVDTCELSPNESVMTNLLGTQNVINAVNEINPQYVKSVLFVSTDKACAPVNVYGMCKAISERIVTSQAQTGLSHIKYLCVRYGNVLESRGSIIPLFKYQAENAEYLTVTDPRMTRFVMTLDDSVDLIMNALALGESGQTWIPHLPSMNINDLAEIFASEFNKQVKITGQRPGEKLHEDLINESESTRVISDKNNSKYHILSPAFNVGKTLAFTYSSADSVMTKQELKEHLAKLKILDMPLKDFKGRNIEEIVK